jgi:hypothetical protein
MSQYKWCLKAAQDCMNEVHKKSMPLNCMHVSAPQHVESQRGEKGMNRMPLAQCFEVSFSFVITA